MSISIYGLHLPKSFQDLLRQKVQVSIYSCLKERPKSNKSEVWFGQAPRHWDDYLKLFANLGWINWGQGLLWHFHDSSLPFRLERSTAYTTIIKIWGTGRTNRKSRQRKKESCLHFFKNCHSSTASETVIIPLTAGSGYDTQMLWVNNGQLYNRSIDSQNWRAKGTLGTFWSNHLFILIIKLRLGERKWFAMDSKSRTGIHSRVLTFSQHGYSKSSAIQFYCSTSRWIQ